MAIDAFDLGHDGTLIACAREGSLVLVTDAGEQQVGPDDIAALGSGLGCVDVVLGARDDAWALLGATDLASPSSDVVCHFDGSAWSCSPLERRVVRGTLVLSTSHVWWIGDATGRGMTAELLVLARSTPGEAPSVVLEDVDATGTLRASPVSEAVLFVPALSASDQSPRRIAIAGATTSLVAGSEVGAYADVWLTRDDRVLALDVLRGETPVCSSGVLGYGGGCSSRIDWTQLVVHELGTNEPRELAHADYGGGGQRTVGIERSDRTVVAGDRWYEVP